MTLPRLCLLSWLVLTPALCVLYLGIPPSPDQALFDYIAWSHLQGDIYYAGVAEQNWPGKMFLHELGIRLFGVAPWTFRAVDFLLLQGLTAAGMLMLWRAGFRQAPWLFLLLYPALYVTAGGWMAGQRDIIATGFLVAAAALSLPARSRQTRGLPECFSAGFLVLLAVIMRPTYLTFLAGLMLVELAVFLIGQQPFRRALLRVLTLSTGFVLPLAVLLWLGQSAGALDDFYQQTILYNIESYQVQQSRLRLFEPAIFLITQSWHWLTLLAVIGAGFWRPAKGASRAAILWLGLLATIVVSYVVQNKGFGYHLSGILLLFSLLAVVGLEGAAGLFAKAGTRTARLLSGTLLAGMVLLAVAGTGKKILSTTANARPQAQISQAVSLISENTTTQDYVLQWGRQFAIPFLAERRTTLRFVSTPALDAMTPAFSGYDAWLAEMEHSLVAKRPTFVIVAPEVLSQPKEQGFAPRPTASAAERLLLAHLAEYDVMLSTADFIILRDRRS